MIEVRQKCNCVFGDGRYGCVVVWNDKNGKDCVCDHNPKGRNLRSMSENLSSVETKFLTHLLCPLPGEAHQQKGLKRAEGSPLDLCWCWVLPRRQGRHVVAGLQGLLRPWKGPFEGSVVSGLHSARGGGVDGAR